MKPLEARSSVHLNLFQIYLLLFLLVVIIVVIRCCCHPLLLLLLSLLLLLLLLPVVVGCNYDAKFGRSKFISWCLNRFARARGLRKKCLKKMKSFDEFVAADQNKSRSNWNMYENK